jgi:toxin ParE1/3/4
MIVRWTKPAVDDLTHICDYTESRFGAPQARRAGLAIYKAASDLQAMPNRGRIGRKAGTREFLVVGLPFIIVYRVTEEAVEIVRILHGAQQWP